MQKKVIALAVAGLLSGAAFAQSSVTFGGTVDVQFYNGSDNTASTTASRNSIDDGGWDASRLWWTADEDLGNGLKVQAHQQFRIDTDRRNIVEVNRSWLQLGGSFGTVKAGTFGNVHDDINGYSEAKGMGYGQSVIGLLTSDTTYNAVQYISPNFSGFGFKAAYSTNDTNGGAVGAAADDANGNGTLNVRAYGLQATYVNGPVKAGLSYDRKSLDSAKANELLLSAGYDFGMFQLGAGFDRTKNEGLNVFAGSGSGYGGVTLIGTLASTNWTKKAFRISGGVSITPNDQVNLSYSRVKYDLSTGASEKANGYGLSYYHIMSKRTNVYVTYGVVSQDEDARMAYTGYQKHFKVGMRHQF